MYNRFSSAGANLNPKSKNSWFQLFRCLEKSGIPPGGCLQERSNSDLPHFHNGSPKLQKAGLGAVKRHLLFCRDSVHPEDYNIHKESTLHLVLRMRGGMMDETSGRKDYKTCQDSLHLLCFSPSCYYSKWRPKTCLSPECIFVWSMTHNLRFTP